jgi:hypothetical protein
VTPNKGQNRSWYPLVEQRESKFSFSITPTAKASIRDTFAKAFDYLEIVPSGCHSFILESNIECDKI